MVRCGGWPSRTRWVHLCGCCSASPARCWHLELWVIWGHTADGSILSTLQCHKSSSQNREQRPFREQMSPRGARKDRECPVLRTVNVSKISSLKVPGSRDVCGQFLQTIFLDKTTTKSIFKVFKYLRRFIRRIIYLRKALLCCFHLIF